MFLFMKPFVLTSVSIIVFFFALLAQAGDACADDPLAKPKDPVALNHLQQGNKLYRVREFEKAIDEYKAGALREDATVFLYNLGQCYRQLGQYEEAIWQYERFLSRAQPTGVLRASVEEFVRQMKAELEKKAMTQPPVEPAPDMKQPTEGPVQPTPSPAAVEPGTAWYSDRIGWGLTAVGAAGLGVSSGLVLSAKGIDGDANAEPAQQARRDLRDRASSRRTLGAIVGVASIGLLTVGVVKLVIHPSKQERATTSWSVGVTSSGVQVFGTF